MAHQVFVGVAEQVVSLGAIAAEVETGAVEDRDEIREAIHHLLAFAELVSVVEVGYIDHPFEVVRLGELRNDLVHLVADFLVALERHHIGEASAFWNIEERILLVGILIGDVFDEQQDQNIVLVLRGIHATA